MPKNNEWVIPKNIDKPIETVYEIKGDECKIPSYEEFMKTYNEKEEVNDNYQSEFDNYGDLRVKGTYYGPGFWDDFAKPVAKGALMVASVFPPTAPIAVTITSGVIITGATTKVMGHISSEEGLKKFGDGLIDIAGDAVVAQQAAGESGLGKKY